MTTPRTPAPAPASVRANPTSATAPASSKLVPGTLAANAATRTGPEAPAPAPAADGKGKPGRKPGQPAKVYDFDGIGLEFIATPRAVSAETASRMAPSRPRDEKQVAMDGIVRKTHAAWVAKNRPGKWVDMPKVEYHVSPAAEEAFVYLVRRAAEFLGLAIKWGGSGGTKHHDTDGNVILVFGVRDRRTRDNSDDDDDDDAGDDDTGDDDTKPATGTDKPAADVTDKPPF